MPVLRIEYTYRHTGERMTLREWLSLPFAFLSEFVEDGGEWLAHKLYQLSDWIAGPSGDVEQ